MTADELKAHKRAVLSHVLGTVQGREFVWDLLELTEPNNTPIRGTLEAEDGMVLTVEQRVFYNIGMADVGRAITKQSLLADLVQYQVMQREAMQRGRDAAAEQNGTKKKETDPDA